MPTSAAPPKRPPRARGGALEHLVDVADRLVAAWSALPTELVGLISLFPLLNPISDLIVCNELISGAHYGAAVAVGLILLAHWRFLALYAALTPLVGYGTSITLYVPFLLLTRWGSIIGEEVSAEELETAYKEAGIQAPARMTDQKGVSGNTSNAQQRSEVAMPRLDLQNLQDATDLESGGPGMAAPISVGSSSAASPPGRAARPLRKPASPGGSKPGGDAVLPLHGVARKRPPGTAHLRSGPPRYGIEAGRLRNFIERNYSIYEHMSDQPLPRFGFLIMFELKLLSMSIIMGPFLLWRAAISTAHAVVFPPVSDEWETPRALMSDVFASEDRLLHGYVLNLMEALYESFPQVLVQSGLLLATLAAAGTPGAEILPLNLYLFSATCSLGVMAVALFNFALHRAEIEQLILHPSRGEYIAHVLSLSEARHIRPAALTAAIAAAMGAGVPATELKPAIVTLQEVRVAHAAALRQNGCHPSMLRDAGFTAAELYAAGFEASRLGEIGLTLPELEALGFQLAELRDSGYSVSVLHAAGHSLDELKGAGATIGELTALGVFSVADLRTAGYKAGAMRNAGFSLDELYGGGYTAEDLKKAGFSIPDLKAAGVPALELKQAGYSIFEIKSAGYPMAEVQELYSEQHAGASAAAPLMLEGPDAGTKKSGKAKARTTPKLIEEATDNERDLNSVYTKLPPNFPDGSSEPWLTCRVEREKEHRPMPATVPAPIFDKQGNQTNKRRWCYKTQGYIGTDAFAR